MISNIAKKAELSGAKNAVLVTTKPPSDTLATYAKAAGVTLRTHVDLDRMRDQLLTITDPEGRQKYLVQAFDLVDDPAAEARRKRTSWLAEIFGSTPTFKPSSKVAPGGKTDWSDPFGLAGLANVFGAPPSPPRRRSPKKGAAKKAKPKKVARRKSRKDDTYDIFGLGSLKF